MKAARLFGPKEFRVVDVENPQLDPDGVIARVQACGVCGSELHWYNSGPQAGQTSRGMGHEYGGEIVEVGANVTGYKVGDRVAGRGGPAFAEYIAIPAERLANRFDTNVVKIPDEMSYEVGSTIEPLSCGVNAALRAQPQSTDTAVVLGAGMIGQGSWQALKAMGVSRVIVTEMGKKRLEITKALGADVVINAAEEDPVERVNELTFGKGAEIVVECVGAGPTLGQALDMVRGGGWWQNSQAKSRGLETQEDILSVGGKIVLVGQTGQQVDWPLNRLVFKSVRIIGSVIGPMTPTMEFIGQGKIQAEPLITHEFSLDEITQAFEMQANADESVKVVVKP